MSSRPNTRKKTALLVDLRKIHQEGYLQEVVERHRQVAETKGLTEADRLYGIIRNGKVVPQ